MDAHLVPGEGVRYVRAPDGTDGHRRVLRPNVHGVMASTNS